jgi:hypothetical protein
MRIARLIVIANVLLAMALTCTTVYAQSYYAGYTPPSGSNTTKRHMTQAEYVLWFGGVKEASAAPCGLIWSTDTLAKAKVNTAYGYKIFFADLDKTVKSGNPDLIGIGLADTNIEKDVQGTGNNTAFQPGNPNNPGSTPKMPVNKRVAGWYNPEPATPNTPPVYGPPPAGISQEYNEAIPSGKTQSSPGSYVDAYILKDPVEDFTTNSGFEIATDGTKSRCIMTDSYGLPVYSPPVRNLYKDDDVNFSVTILLDTTDPVGLVNGSAILDFIKKLLDLRGLLKVQK